MNKRSIAIAALCLMLCACGTTSAPADTAADTAAPAAETTAPAEEGTKVSITTQAVPT